MSYVALYRKFRPVAFHDVKGQDHIVSTLKNQIESNRIGHAYLFCGTRGTGKTTVAKIFARAVNCEHPTEDGPCNECSMCQMINDKTAMNVIEIDAASNNRVDDIRQVIEEVQYSPSQGKYKVYIIDEVHMLTTSAFNALLKTLEEPPAYVIFILATTEPHKIPLTILSRCQRYDFKRISAQTIALRMNELIEQEQIKIEEQAVNYIAKAADGAMRDALSLLEQCVSYHPDKVLTYDDVLTILGAVEVDVYHQMMQLVVKEDIARLMKNLDDVVMQGKDLLQFASEFVWYLRNLLIVKTSPQASDMIDMSAENLATLKETADKLEVEAIFRYIRIISQLAGELKYASSKRVLWEVTLIKMCKPQMETDYDSLVQRIHSLEKQMEQGVPTVITQAAAPASEPVKQKPKILPQALSDDVKRIVKGWPKLVGRMDVIDRGMLEQVKLSADESGHLLIVFSDMTSYEYFKKSEEHEQRLGKYFEDAIQKQVAFSLQMIDNKEEIDSIEDLKNLINADIEFE